MPVPFRRPLEGLDAALELVFGGTVSGEHANGRVRRPAKNLAAERLSALEHAVQVSHRGRSNLGSGEIGLVSGPITVTAVAPRPRLFSRLPSRSNGARSAVSKIGTSTASKPIAFNWSRIASCSSVTCGHSSRFMPNFMVLFPCGRSLTREVLTIEKRNNVEPCACPCEAQQQPESFLPRATHPVPSRSLEMSASQKSERDVETMGGVP